MFFYDLRYRFQFCVQSIVRVYLLDQLIIFTVCPLCAFHIPTRHCAKCQPILRRVQKIQLHAVHTEQVIDAMRLRSDSDAFTDLEVGDAFSCVCQIDRCHVDRQFRKLCLIQVFLCFHFQVPRLCHFVPDHNLCDPAILLDGGRIFHIINVVVHACNRKPDLAAIILFDLCSKRQYDSRDILNIGFLCDIQKILAEIYCLLVLQLEGVDPVQRQCPVNLFDGQDSSVDLYQVIDPFPCGDICLVCPVYTVILNSHIPDQDLLCLFDLLVMRADQRLNQLLQRS